MKDKTQTHKQQSYGFTCVKCRQPVPEAHIEIGTDHRDHCPFCLYSRHVDQDKPGDRKSTCKSKMKPIGLTFKNNSWELMIVYECLGCGKIIKNRCAGDDAPFALIDVFRLSLKLLQSDMRTKVYINKLKQEHIEIASRENTDKILNGIYGVGYVPNEIHNEFGISVV